MTGDPDDLRLARHLDPLCAAGRRVLVVGGGGYVGERCVAALRARGVAVVSADKRHATEGTQVQLDLCDAAAVAAVWEQHRPDVVLHCGTLSAAAYAADFPGSFEIDYTALRNMLRAGKAHPDARWVYFSSNYVYSGIGARTVDEGEPLLPAHAFGVAKAFFEQLLLRARTATVFRMSSVYGVGNSQHPNAIIEMAREAEQTGAITVWGTGKRQMQYVSIEDVVHAIFASLSAPAGLYNLGGDDYVSVAHVATRIAARVGVEVRYLPDKREGMTLPRMACDKLKGALGADLFRGFDDDLQRYLAAPRP